MTAAVVFGAAVVAAIGVPVVIGSATRALAPSAAYAAALPSPPAKSLPLPKGLPAATRAELRSRMGRHGNAMSNLVRAVVLLDRPTIAALAGRIADEEVVARVEDDGADKLKAALSKAVFDEQDALKNGARDLAAAAAYGEDDGAIADRFATLARTCVNCHSAYLHGGAGEVR